MASERSFYRKIQLVLEEAAVSRAGSLAQLTAGLQKKKLPNFNTLQYDEEKDEFVWRQSPKVLTRTVTLCCDLQLLDETGGLTKDGREALRKTQFDAVVATKTRAALARSGVSPEEINQKIRESLQRKPPILPTASILWAEVEPKVSKAEFSRYLALLSHCGAADSSQAKVYLRLDTKSIVS